MTKITIPEDFDWEYYLKANPDIAKIQKYKSKEGAKEHYLGWGYKENRKYCEPKPKANTVILDDKVTVVNKKIALCCIAKDEDQYIQEWLEYNYKLGFDHIFLYENDWKCSVDLPYLTKIPITGNIQQLTAYNSFINTYKNVYDYVAFFDCDEFLVLKVHKNIQDFVAEYDNSNGIAINWQMYGADGRETYDPKYPNSLLKQFTKRQKGVNTHIKTILNLKKPGKMTLPHNPDHILLDTNGKEIDGPYNPNGPDDIAVINHYCLKTYADWSIRCKRGRADSKLKSSLGQWEIEKYYNCEEEDLYARDFMYGPSLINDYFDKIYCINLDRRKDKWNVVNKRFIQSKINIERFSAIDGDDIPIDMIKKHSKLNKNEIGCMLSHYAIIKDAESKKYKRILILEDDVIFFKDFNKTFFEQIEGIKDWKLLYLGASQHFWKHLEYGKSFYYSKDDLGTFAIAIDQSMYSKILETAPIKNMAIDKKLTVLQDENYKDCYTLYPNLIISDVNISDIRNSQNLTKHSKITKWDLSLYDAYDDYDTKKISFCVPAYNAEDYIEECLDSIEAQYCEKEILVGVDGCETTLKKIEQIKHKYANLKVFWFPENVGAYVVRNTLAMQSEYDILSFFDSDDIMAKDFIITALPKLKEKSIVRSKYYDFDLKSVTPSTDWYGNWILLIHKKDFLDINGFWEERIASDLDFINRSEMNGCENIELDDFLVNRRTHGKNISLYGATGMGSDIRNDIHKEIEFRKKYKIVKNENLVISNCVEVKRKEIMVLMVTTYNRIDFLKKTLESWDKTRDKNYEWILIISDDSSTDGTLAYIENLSFDGVKKIVIKNNRVGIFHQTNNLIKLVNFIDFDFGFKIDDDLIFLKEGWDTLYLNAAKKTKYPYLIYFDKEWANTSKCARPPVYENDMLENVVSAENTQGAFWTFNKQVLKEVGYFDTDAFGLCGWGDIDYTLRCCRLGFNNINTPYDIKNSNEYISLNKKNYHSNNNYNNLWNRPEQVAEKKKNLLLDRTYIPYKTIGKNIEGETIWVDSCEPVITKCYPLINDYFDNIYCLNLDRREDKWATVQKSFNKLKINVERFSAIDGNNFTEEELKKYTKINKNEIGCMLSHYEIIKDAKKKRYKRILIFEDDVIFAENFHNLFLNKITKIGDWKLFYLGASQWIDANLKYVDDFYYANQTDGTFAFAIDESIYDEILESAEITNRPIDNKLFDIQKKYSDSSYVCFPNLVISSVSNSDIRAPRDNASHRIKMKWNIIKYE